MTSHSTVPDYLALAMHIYRKILGSVYTVIYGVALHCNSCTHGLPLKIDIRNAGIFPCRWHVTIHTDLDRGCITEDTASLVYLRVHFGSSVTK